MRVASCLRCLLLAGAWAGLAAGAEPGPPEPPAGNANLAPSRVDAPPAGHPVPDAPVTRERSRTAPAAAANADASASNPTTKSPTPAEAPGRSPAPSASWRVEGRAPGKTSNAPAESSFGLPPGDPSVAVGLASEGDLLRVDPRRPATLAKPAAGAANPLTTYMAAWMTPRDFDLLQVRPTEPNASPVPARMPAGRDALRTGAAPAGGGPVVTGLGGPGPEAPANPYLVDLTPKPAIGPKGPVAIAPGVTPPAAVVPPNPGVVTPPKPPTPAADRFKGKDDAKFFPQLRRF